MVTLRFPYCWHACGSFQLINFIGSHIKSFHLGLVIVFSVTRHCTQRYNLHDDVIKWKHFPHYRPFVRGIHRLPVNSPHKGQWRGALVFSLICAWINAWVNNRDPCDLRRHHAHYDVIVMSKSIYQIFDSQQISHISPSRASYDVSAWSFWIKLSCCNVTVLKISSIRNFKLQYPYKRYGLTVKTILVKLFWGECRWTHLMFSQHWLR